MGMVKGDETRMNSMKLLHIKAFRGVGIEPTTKGL